MDSKRIKSTYALTFAISDFRVLIATTQGSAHSKCIQDHSLDIALIKQVLQPGKPLILPGPDTSVKRRTAKRYEKLERLVGSGVHHR